MPGDSPFAHSIARVRLTHIVGGMRQSNVYHVLDLTGEATAEHYQDILSAFVYWWQFGYDGAAAPRAFVGHGSDLVLSSIEFVLSHLLPGPVQVLFDLVTAGSLGAAAAVPAGASPALTWKTAFGGRRGTGRTYLIGLDSSLLDGDRSSYVSWAAASLIEDSYTALIAALRDATEPAGLFALCLYHRFGRDVGGGSRVWGDPLVRARFTDRLLDTQRPRLPRHRK